nr:hypothetical protein GCM10020063_055650 [Dactylosporangium thailandense]
MSMSGNRTTNLDMTSKIGIDPGENVPPPGTFGVARAGDNGAVTLRSERLGLLFLSATPPMAHAAARGPTARPRRGVGHGRAWMRDCANARMRG